MSKDTAAPQFDRVLLVDDNDIDNFINERLLTTSGFARTVVVKNSGAKALEYLSSIGSDTNQLPQVIFLDLNMPVMDGFQFLEEYEKFDSAVTQFCKVIVLSSSISHDDINRASTNVHVRKYLNKPLAEKYLSAISF